MSNNKIKLVVEVDEYCRDAIIRHRNGTYGAQLPYYIISSAFEAIANGTPYNPSGDLISREAVKANMKKADEQSDTFEMLVEFYEQIIDHAPTVPLPNEQIAWEQGYEAGLAQGKQDRPQGEWLEYNATGKKQYMCSKCSMKEKNPKIARYCYWCGAKMKGGAEE